MDIYSHFGVPVIVQPSGPIIITVGQSATINCTLGDEIILISWNVELMNLNTTISVKPHTMS